MGVEERGLSCFEPADEDLAPPVAANRRLLLAEVVEGKSFLSANPLELDAGVSARCNISCGFCNGPEEGYGDLTDRRRDEIAGMLPSLMRFGVCGPGEPLMSPNYLALLGQISDTGYPSLSVSLTTNGTLLSPAFLERHANVPWSHVRISLNAGSPETHERMTGSKLFRGIMRNLDALCALRERRPGRFRVTLSCVLGEVQMGDLHRFAEVVTSHGTDVAIEPMTGNLGSLSPWVRPDRLAILADELRSVADDYALRNPPLSRAFRAAEGYARTRLGGDEFLPLALH